MRQLLGGLTPCALQVGQSQRPVSGTGSIRRSNRRVTEPESRAVVDDTPGVQLAAIFTLNSYGPVIDGHRVRGYMPTHTNAILEIDGRRSLKSRREI